MVEYTFSLDKFEIFLLVLVRISCFIYIAPFFGMTNVPRRVKIGLAVCITVLVYQFVDTSHIAYAGMISYTVIVLKEGITGLLIFIPYTVVCLVKAIKTFRFDCSSLIPFTMLVTILFNGVGENTLGTRIFWFAAGLCLMISRQKRENKMPVAEKSTVFAKIRRKYEKT